MSTSTVISRIAYRRAGESLVVRIAAGRGYVTVSDDTGVIAVAESVSDAVRALLSAKQRVALTQGRGAVSRFLHLTPVHWASTLYDFVVLRAGAFRLDGFDCQIELLASKKPHAFGVLSYVAIALINGTALSGIGTTPQDAYGSVSRQLRAYTRAFSLFKERTA